MDLSADRRRISDEEKPKRFADGRSLYSGGYNPMAVDCAVGKMAWMFNVAGAELKETEGKEQVKEQGKEQVNSGKVNP
jgi:hypothetical protein